MSLADAKARFLRSNGEQLTFVRTSGNVTTVGRILPSKQRTTHAINFVRSVILLPGSGAIPGELVRVETSQELFLFDAMQPKTRGGSVISWSGELLKVNYPELEIQRQQISVDANLNLVGNTSWMQIAMGPAHVEHVTAGGRSEQHRSGLLLSSTEFLITRKDDANLKLNDRCLIDGKPYKVDDINLSIVPGLQLLQVSTDERK